MTRFPYEIEIHRLRNVNVIESRLWEKRRQPLFKTTDSNIPTLVTDMFGFV